MTARGKFVLKVLLLAIVGLGAWKWWDKLKPAPAGPSAPVTQTATPSQATVTSSSTPADASSYIVPLTSSPTIDPPGIYVPKDNTVDIELSEYAGYAGLVAANGGLDPSESSYFFQKHGFKVRIRLSEEESWAALNAGRMAASATTVDVLAAYCRNFQVTAPVQIGYSRGADGLVVRKEIRRINDLAGRVVTASQFTEAEFFVRYLAQEAGIPVNVLSGPGDRPKADSINLLFAVDAFTAGDLFAKDLAEGGKRIAGCMTWAPKTTEVVDGSNGAAHMLTTNRNLLIIADIMIVNKGFAQANPKIVAGLVDGLLAGNRMVNEQQSTVLPVIARAFKWSPDEAKAELAKVHLSNLPENLAFYSGAIDSAGSFPGIFSSAILAYGSLIDRPSDADRFMDPQYLNALQTAGAYAGQTVSIAPIGSKMAATLEGDPLLSKNIRFLFEPNSSNLDLQNQDNLTALDSIKRLLTVSPGSTILLRGHVDDSLVDSFRQKGGEAFVHQMALKAMELSKDRANDIRKVLMERLKVPGDRLQTIGRGWEEPLGKDAEQNRRVEVQWFTVE